MSAEEQSDEVDFRLFLLGVRVIQHIVAVDRGWIGEEVEMCGQRS